MLLRLQIQVKWDCFAIYVFKSSFRKFWVFISKRHPWQICSKQHSSLFPSATEVIMQYSRVYNTSQIRDKFYKNLVHSKLNRKFWVSGTFRWEGPPKNRENQGKEHDLESCQTLQLKFVSMYKIGYWQGTRRFLHHHKSWD